MVPSIIFTGRGLRDGGVNEACPQVARPITAVQSRAACTTYSMRHGLLQVKDFSPFGKCLRLAWQCRHLCVCAKTSITIYRLQAFQASMQAALKPDELEEFAIRGQEVEVDEAAGKGAPAAGMLVSVEASGAAPDGGKEPKKGAEASSLYKKMQGKRKGGKGSKVVSGKRPKR